MKKIFLTILSMMVAFEMSAITYTDQVSITLDDGETYYHTMVVGESNDLAANAITNGYASEIQNLSEMPVAIYAIFNGTDYSTLAMKNLKNIPVGIKTDSKTHYTMYFDDLTGTVLLYDTQLSQWVSISEGGDYEFDAPANSLINDRFYLFYDASEMYNVTMNAYGLATFSLDVATALPQGLKAYSAKYQSFDEYLLLSQLTNYIPAGTGVILYGNANAQYTLTKTSASVSPVADNDLKPASAWTANPGNVYVLKGNLMYEYIGDDMKANKAYLDLGSTPAPKRIRLVFEEATAIDNVEIEAVKAVKFVENGQLYIRRGNEVFNLQGQIVK